MNIETLLYKLLIYWKTEEEFMKVLSEVLLTLSPKEKFVIEQRFGLTGESPKTLREVGTLLKPTSPYHKGNAQNSSGVTQERVRQIEAKALRKLRHPSRMNKLLQSIGLMPYKDTDSIIQKIKADLERERFEAEIIATEPIEVLLLPTKIENALKSASIDTIAELRRVLSTKQILHIRNMGMTSMRRIEGVLAEYDRMNQNKS